MRHGDFLHRLQQTECSLSIFSDASALLTALAMGHRFELLMLPVQQQAVQMEQLTMVCETLSMPMLVVTMPRHADMAQSGGDLFLRSAHVDLVSADATDIEIDWRVRALLRRTRASTCAPDQPSDLVVGAYTFVEDQRAVLLHQRRITLQPRQFELAREFFLNVNKVLSRDRLLLSLWGTSTSQESARSLNVCVTNVRKKLELRYENGFALRSIYRHGYMLSSMHLPASISSQLARSTEFANDVTELS